jgi:hypothetical protein
LVDEPLYRRPRTISITDTLGISPEPHTTLTSRQALVLGAPLEEEWDALVYRRRRSSCLREGWQAASGHIPR